MFSNILALQKQQQMSYHYKLVFGKFSNYILLLIKTRLLFLWFFRLNWVFFAITKGCYLLFLLALHILSEVLVFSCTMFILASVNIKENVHIPHLICKHFIFKKKDENMY